MKNLYKKKHIHTPKEYMNRKCDKKNISETMKNALFLRLNCTQDLRLCLIHKMFLKFLSLEVVKNLAECVLTNFVGLKGVKYQLKYLS